MNGSLFISYSHLDKPLMQVFKKHLHGMLFDRCQVWTDEDIPPGTTWEDSLLGSLRQAATGLVLASADYLVSPWCRRELKSLAEARRNRRLGALYWVLLEPCGWQWTELSQLQAVQEPANRALEDTPEGPEREARMLQICERIATGTLSFINSEDPVVAAVRNLLRNSDQAAQVVPISAMLKGDFSIVCRGLQSNGDDVVIKVLTNTPLHRMRELFLEVSHACRSLADPSVIRICKVFTVGEGYEQRIVILSDLARGVPLSQVIAEDTGKPHAQRHFTPDRIGVVLRRIARALQALHALAPIEWEGNSESRYTHLMGPLVPANIYYDSVTMRPQISLVGVTNFLWHFFEPDTFTRIVGPRSGTYLLPEKLRKEVVDARADQYFLGMLALELLEARPLFAAPAGSAPVDPLDYLQTQADAHWAERHEQMRGIVARLLAPRPADRFSDMAEVVASLDGLEESSRALAKYAFRRHVAPEAGGAQAGVVFSERFYANFFASMPSVRAVFDEVRWQREGPSAAAPAGALPGAAHHHKLMDALKAVLNFRVGSAPSAIDSIAVLHAGYAHIEPAHFQAFEQSFIETLQEQLATGNEGAEEQVDICAAWRQLFAPVLLEMAASQARLQPAAAVAGAGG